MSVAQLEAFLEDRWSSYVRDWPLLAGSPLPNVVPGLAEDESAGFLRGLAAGLFSVSDHGDYEHAHLRYGGGEAHLFGGGRAGATRNLERETIPQRAAAADLVCVLGWLAPSVWIETPRRALDGDHPVIAPRRAADLAILPDGVDGDAVMIGEVKSRSSDLDTLLSHLERCFDSGWGHAGCPGFSGGGAHKKYLAVAAFQPRYLWFVAPDDRRCFAVKNMGEGRFRLSASSLPEVD